MNKECLLKKNLTIKLESRNGNEKKSNQKKKKKRLSQQDQIWQMKNSTLQ
jgi:hypothetical protein